MARSEEIRRQWARDNAEQLHNAPSKAKSLANRIYAGGKSNLVDASTRQRIASDWQAQRQRPSKRFKRKPFRRRGIRGDEDQP
jgi:hypothetical protein